MGIIPLIIKDAVRHKRLVKITLKNVRLPLYGWLEEAAPVRGMNQASEWLRLRVIRHLEDYFADNEVETFPMPLPASLIEHIEVMREKRDASGK